MQRHFCLTLFLQHTNKPQYLVVTLGTSKQTTPSISKTLNPEWNTCFEMPLGEVPLVECVCWDKDRFGKDYLGEFECSIEEIFANGQTTQEASHRHLPTRVTLATLYSH